MKKILGLLVLVAISLYAAAGSDLYKKCSSCHGINGEKKAFGKSEVIGGWDENQTIAALIGYKDGTYGKAMKGMMKGQVSSLSDDDIKALAKHINSLK